MAYCMLIFFGFHMHSLFCVFFFLSWVIPPQENCGQGSECREVVYIIRNYNDVFFPNKAQVQTERFG